MLYEIATVVLGVWGVTLQLRLNHRDTLVHKLSVSLDNIAEGAWEIKPIDGGGFEVYDKADNERMIAVKRVKA